MTNSSTYKHYLLTSSLDWTVKLWSLNHLQRLCSKFWAPHAITFVMSSDLLPTRLSFWPSHQPVTFTCGTWQDRWPNLCIFSLCLLLLLMAQVPMQKTSPLLRPIPVKWRIQRLCTGPCSLEWAVGVGWRFSRCRASIESAFTVRDDFCLGRDSMEHDPALGTAIATNREFISTEATRKWHKGKSWKE